MYYLWLIGQHPPNIFVMFQIQGNLTVPVQVSNCDNLSSNKVVESVDWAGVYETVSHPQTSLYHFLDLSQDLHTQTHSDHYLLS